MNPLDFSQTLEGIQVKHRHFFMALAMLVKNQKPLRDLLEDNKLEDEISINNPQ